MGTKSRDPKTVLRSFRLTASENARLDALMKAEDYTNLSKYIRHKIFGSRLIARKPRNLDADEIREMINSIIERIAGVGADYNRIVDELVRNMDKPGGENIRNVNRCFSEINFLTKDIKDSVNGVIELFHRIEDVMNTNNKSIQTLKVSKVMAQTITILGNIVSDAEMKQGRDGNSQFIAFRVAVNETYGDDKKTTYYDVSYPSSGLVHFLKKGKPVYVSGNLSLSLSTGRDGKSYMNANISAKTIELVGPKEN